MTGTQWLPGGRTLCSPSSSSYCRKTLRSNVERCQATNNVSLVYSFIVEGYSQLDELSMNRLRSSDALSSFVREDRVGLDVGGED
jgi:hypothetical protein